MRRNPIRQSALAVGLLAVVIGCTPITVRPVAAPDLPDDGWTTAVGSDHLSPRTLQTLRRYNLNEVALTEPDGAMRYLHSFAVQEPRPDALFALAELSYLRGRAAEKKKQSDAVDHYFRCAGYAYHYLEGDASPYDPQFRRACELYNAGLVKCLRAAQKAGGLNPEKPGELTLPCNAGGRMTVTHVAFPWRPDEFGPVLFCADYEVEGLPETHRTFGLGVPLIAVRSAAAPRPYVPPAVCFPATAFLHFDGTLDDVAAGRGGRLELVNPLRQQAVVVQTRRVPLETDTTTPIALFLSKAKLKGEEFLGFLRPQELAARTGIHMLEPYQPGKIPVLLVHGLLSSPETWAPLYNDLLADAELRSRFQFWFYFYPTGNPYLDTAADLRARLAKLREDLDPAGRDRELGEMVLIGHSMGGLVSRMVTADSGNDFWTVCGGPGVAKINLTGGASAEVRRLFFFERRPEIRRVIFLGTPHHGSNLSPALTGVLAAKLVRLPVGLVSLAKDIAAADPAQPASEFSTSVDMLAPESPALKWLVEQPRPDGVTFHSIVGVVPANTVRLERWLAGDFSGERGDGVVTYSSAHLEGVESELIVPANHYQVHQHPISVLEVRRILREHARAVRNPEIDVAGFQDK